MTTSEAMRRTRTTARVRRPGDDRSLAQPGRTFTGWPSRNILHAVVLVALCGSAVLAGCGPRIQQGSSRLPDGTREEYTFFYREHVQVRDGPLTRFRADGSLLERQQYDHGAPCGTWERYWPAGTIKRRTRWEDGHPVQEQDFDENGLEIGAQDQRARPAPPDRHH